MSLIEANGDTDDSNQKLANHHAAGTPDEQRTTTEFLNCVERDRRGADIDQSEDQRDQKCVRDRTSRL